MKLQKKKPLKKLLFGVTGMALIFSFVFIVGVSSIVNEMIMMISSQSRYSGMGTGMAINLSADVEKWRAEVQRQAEALGIGEYTDLLLAIMMQESGGRVADLFQCSESLGLAPNSISEQQSITQAVKLVANLIESCEVKSPGDEAHIRLLLQAYNFGSGYITYALEHGGGWTQENAFGYAKIHSGGRMRSGVMVERIGKWAYGDQYYPDHVFRYYSITAIPGSFASDGTVAAGVAGTIDKRQRMKYLFPNGVPSTESQMAPYLTTITVPINDINGKPTTMNLTIHKKIASDVKAAFTDMQRIGFRVDKRSTGAYCWRGMASNSSTRSYHSYGTCIDINPVQNPFTKNPPGNYRPYVDPLSITPEVVNIWKSHGFYWGGDWKSYKDYMHMTYTGN